MAVNPPFIMTTREIWQVATPEEAMGKALKMMRKVGVDPTPTDEVLEPTVNHGRWVATCSNCLNGVPLWDAMDVQPCVSCGLTYQAVNWPPAETTEEAVRLLLNRPRSHNRHWYPRHESVEMLKVENLRAGESIFDGLHDA